MATEVTPDWPAAVRIVRSDRRRRTVSARIEGDTILVQMPAGLPPAEERRLADKLVERLRAQRLRRQLNSETDLQARAGELNRRHFAGRLRWNSIEYVTDQERRLGSCTPATGKIRISHRLADVPEWVRDYVIVHELAHLEHTNHGQRFWAAVNRYHLAERARGYLLALDLRGDEDDGDL
ncbi:MAG: M48 metallopeptidase family protein [Dehalococcoidia bacterium]